MNFNEAVNLVIKSEGGFVDHPQDPGGATNFGITERVARAYGYTGDMRTLLEVEAELIYKTGYWDKNNVGQLPWLLQYPFFDACVNHGGGNARRMLQRSLGVADDGVVGPLTLAKICEAQDVTLVLLFTAERIKFYTKLSTFKTFGAGWMNRMAEVLTHVK
jgi:lysozyme family protein